MSKPLPTYTGPALMVRCPTCGCKPGYACVVVEGASYKKRTPHSGRLRDYQVWKEGFSSAAKLMRDIPKAVQDILQDIP